MASGGYQRPSSPAPVSGPGALSQRTDGGPGSTQAAQYISGLPYGQGQELMATQGAASMEASPLTSPVPSGMAVGGKKPQQMPEMQPVVPLNAPTQRPNEPITSGADIGPGPGMASLGLNIPNLQADKAWQARLASYLPALNFVADQPHTSAETRNIIRQLRSMI